MSMFVFILRNMFLIFIGIFSFLLIVLINIIIDCWLMMLYWIMANLLLFRWYNWDLVLFFCNVVSNLCVIFCKIKLLIWCFRVLLMFLNWFRFSNSIVMFCLDCFVLINRLVSFLCKELWFGNLVKVLWLVWKVNCFCDLINVVFVCLWLLIFWIVFNMYFIFLSCKKFKFILVWNEVLFMWWKFYLNCCWVLFSVVLILVLIWCLECCLFGCDSGDNFDSDEFISCLWEELNIVNIEGLYL